MSPFGQPPLPVSLWIVRLPSPLIDAASILGRLASQSVQNRILTTGEKLERDSFWQLKQGGYCHLSKMLTCSYSFKILKSILLTHLEGPGQWPLGALPPQPAGWFSLFHPVWQPQSDPDCSPPSKCFLLSSLQPGPLEWQAHTGSPPQNWSGLGETNRDLVRIVFEYLPCFPQSNSQQKADSIESYSLTCQWLVWVWKDQLFELTLWFYSPKREKPAHKADFTKKIKPW